jgi:hypothetical protein
MIKNSALLGFAASNARGRGGSEGKSKIPHDFVMLYIQRLFAGAIKT